MFTKKIGIVGGAGPWASAHAHMRLIELAQWDFAAVEDHDYPEIYVQSKAIPGFGSSGIEDLPLVAKSMQETLKSFVQLGVEICIMACNSLHTLHHELSLEFPQIKILHLPKEAASFINSRNYQKVAILCSDSSVQDSLHATALKELGINFVLPDQRQQVEVNKLIYAVMAGDLGIKQAQIFRKIEAEFIEQGADLILSGCTELCQITHQYQASLPVVDALYVTLRKSLYLAKAD